MTSKTTEPFASSLNTQASELPDPDNYKNIKGYRTFMCKKSTSTNLLLYERFMFLNINRKWIEFLISRRHLIVSIICYS